MAQTWDQARLERVQQARIVPPSGQSLAELLAREDVAGLGADHRGRAVFEALCGLGDGGFRKRCRFGALKAGELVLLVEDPTELAGLRMRWTRALVAQLAAACPEGRVKKVVFREGQGGAVLARAGRGSASS